MTSDAEKTNIAEERATAARRGVLTLSAGDDAGRVIPIEGSVILGRSPKATVCLLDTGLSRLHARFSRFADDYLVQDLGSTNGTFVNDARIDFAASLKDGDRVRLGTSATLRFTVVDEAEERALTEVYESAKRERVLSAFNAADDSRSALHEDLAQAREFQRRALPEAPELEHARVDLLFRPLDLVGGDLYHVALIGDRVLRIFIADATGHGVKASLTTMLILSEYELVRRRASSPAAALEELNERIATTYAHLRVYFTAACIDLDLKRGVLEHASAAHPSPYLLRDGAAIELECGGTLMGLSAGAKMPSWSIDLAGASALVAFTDGATEVSAPGGDLFGDAGVAKAIAAARPGSDLAASLAGAVDSFAAGSPLTDDLTIVAVRWGASL